MIEKACEYLERKAYPKYDQTTCGKCATAVRQAFDFATGKSMPHTESAKDYGPIYERIGFKKIFSYPAQPKTSYNPQLGDLCIIQYEPHGHICVKTKDCWISDFKQIDMYGGHIRDQDPSFTIYRYS